MKEEIFVVEQLRKRDGRPFKQRNYWPNVYQDSKEAKNLAGWLEARKHRAVVRRAVIEADDTPCVWTGDDEGHWTSSCPDGFTMMEPPHNVANMTYCPKCGRKIQEAT